MITLITPGGGRPQAFALCEKFMARQTIWGKENIQWIVVDDNEKDPVKCTMGQLHIFGELPWKIGFNTLRYNLAAALPHVEGDYVFIIENDDNYQPLYLEVYLALLKYAVIVGGTDVTYYSLKTRGFREMKNFNHASTCQTAFRSDYIPYFERAIHSGEQYFDILLWNTARAAKHKYILFSASDLCVGMKGLPGRPGVGVGHGDNEFVSDPHFVKLRQLVGPEDAKVYEAMVK